MASLRRFLKKLGIEPRDLPVYRRALTHVSAAESHVESYERLEFLGDGVIGMIIGDFLYKRFPGKEEGDLSRIRALVVSRESLGGKAEELGLDEHLRADTVRVREGEGAEFSIMADCFEALVGAVFADRGYRAARTFVLRHLGEQCLDLQEMVGPFDYKSRLQELWQQKYKDTPDYVVISERGPDHNKVFVVEVRYEGKVLGKGQGSSKKRAEEEAAMMAHERAMEKGKKKRGKR